jgi:16S rRNA (guanine966-N2)-methyltransferase
MAKPSGNRNTFRIIAGEYRSRKLAFPDGEGLRPTSDRTRETLFNWLSPAIEGATVVDLFAGSGALGFESLSRGATRVYFIDNATNACRHIRENLQLLKDNRGECVCDDALNWLEQNPAKADIVFLDPPFSRPALMDQAIELIQQQGLVKTGGYIYMELPIKQNNPKVPENWQETRQKTAGNVSFRLYSCQ